VESSLRFFFFFFSSRLRTGREGKRKEMLKRCTPKRGGGKENESEAGPMSSSHGSKAAKRGNREKNPLSEKKEKRRTKEGSLGYRGRRGRIWPREKKRRKGREIPQRRSRFCRKRSHWRGKKIQGLFKLIEKRWGGVKSFISKFTETEVLSNPLSYLEEGKKKRGRNNLFQRERRGKKERGDN